MVLVDGAGTPLGAYLDSASPSEMKLLGRTLDTVAVGRAGRPGRPRKRPDRLIADRGYDRLGHFRHFVTRHERLLETYSGFFHIACALLTPRRVLKRVLRTGQLYTRCRRV